MLLLSGLSHRRMQDVSSFVHGNYVNTPMQYTTFITALRILIFQRKFVVLLLIFPQNMHCGYLLKRPLLRRFIIVPTIFVLMELKTGYGSLPLSIEWRFSWNPYLFQLIKKKKRFFEANDWFNPVYLKQVIYPVTRLAPVCNVKTFY